MASFAQPFPYATTGLSDQEFNAIVEVITALMASARISQWFRCQDEDGATWLSATDPDGISPAFMVARKNGQYLVLGKTGQPRAMGNRLEDILPAVASLSR